MRLLLPPVSKIAASPATGVDDPSLAVFIAGQVTGPFAAAEKVATSACVRRR